MSNEQIKDEMLAKDAAIMITYRSGDIIKINDFLATKEEFMQNNYIEYFIKSNSIEFKKWSSYSPDYIVCFKSNYYSYLNKFADDITYNDIPEEISVSNIYIIRETETNSGASSWWWFFSGIF